MKLRTHYVLLAISVVLPVAVFCGIALHMLQNAQHDSAIKRIEEAALLTARVIDADIHRAESVLRVLAGSQALGQVDLARFHEEATHASAAPGGWIILYDLKGQQIVNTRHHYGAALPMRPDPDTVTQLVASGQGRVSGIRWGAALKNHFVMVETPITANNGRQYVIGQAFSPAFFAKAFEGATMPPSWRVAILDSTGIIIARSARADYFVGKRFRQATLDVLAQSRSGVFRNRSGDDTEVYDAYTRSARSGWSVIIGAPVAEINAAVFHSISLVGAGIAIALLASLTLAILAGRHLVNFVTRASAAAASLGLSTPHPDIPTSSIDDLEALNESIRRAGARLQEEVESRARAEHERNDLLVREQAARVLAEEQNAAKDEFLAMLGHELRNPLSAITSAVAILDRSASLDPSASERARDVLRRQTAHLRKMVDDLLEVNRALMGKLTLEREAVDLSDVVRRCLDTLHDGGRTGRFDIRLEAVPALVDADPARLLQVIDNVLDNAIKYSPNGGRIDISVRHEGDDVMLTVCDTGQGIAAHLLPSVFEIFVQGAQPLQRATGGLGIGLSLVRRLVNMHGGTVRIDSEGQDRGTTLTLTLPRLAQAPASAPVPASTDTERPRRVMLVEDNVDAREMMTMLLEMHGCSVRAAASGPDGIALAMAERPELAIIDIGLPGMDGYAVARALKDNPATAAIELIALTGYGSEDDRQRAIAAGFARHFTKPIRMEDLRAALA